MDSEPSTLYPILFRAFRSTLFGDQFVKITENKLNILILVLKLS